ncbi:MAG: 50S ribosomal protein L23 [Candidatus Doudnabacteria bacterium]|nr:50S ribosomal protein L23 [Candidatus Doudnabacteria bacterium]
MVKEESKSEKKAQLKLKEDTGRAHRVLKQYHLSEKTNQLSSMGRYVFVVDKKSNKIEIKKAVESVYEVHVVSVNIINTKGKFRAYGRTSGKTSEWKKAIVTLKSGESISGLAEGV